MVHYTYTCELNAQCDICGNAIKIIAETRKLATEELNIKGWKDVHNGCRCPKHHGLWRKRKYDNGNELVSRIDAGETFEGVAKDLGTTRQNVHNLYHKTKDIRG